MRKEWDCVLVTHGSLIPIVGETLVAGSVGVVAICAGHGVEVLKMVAGEIARRICRGVVRHEAIHESIRSWRGDGAGERPVEEVRVGLDAILETVVPVLRHGVEIVVDDIFWCGIQVDELLE